MVRCFRLPTMEVDPTFLKVGEARTSFCYKKKPRGKLGLIPALRLQPSGSFAQADARPLAPSCFDLEDSCQCHECHAMTFR